MQQLTLMDGVELKDVRTYARNKLVTSGIIKPETTEEEDLLAQSQQQPPQPDANMMLAMAEQGKADANMADVKRKAELDKFNAMTQQGKLQVAQFDSQTKRMAVQVDAEEANASIEFKRIDTLTNRMDKVNQHFRARVNPEYA